MTGLTQLIRQFAITVLTVLQWMLFFRALLSWIPQMQGGKLAQVLYQLTEPLVAPFRSLLSRIPAMRTFPVDISFLVAYFVLLLVQRFLYFY